MEVEAFTAVEAFTVAEAEAFTVAAVTGNFRFQHSLKTTDDTENQLMRTTNIKTGRLGSGLAGLIASAVFLLVMVGYAGISFAQTSQPKTFSSPAEACNALFQALQNGDEQGLEAILGVGREITSSNDEVEDKLERERFSQKYQEMHRLVREPDGRTVLYIGAENWPFPIPLVSKNGVWYFDSDTGKQEILFRTIGENEATAIQVCNEFATVRKQRATTKSGDDPIAGYAQTLVSVSTANAGKTADATHEIEPSFFQGYYFQIRNNNGSIALVAYPVKYRSSGVMTFIVTQDGVVYERDLGPETATVAPRVRTRGSSWHEAE